MRDKALIGALAIGLAALLTAQAAAAETLDLVCRVHWSKPGGAHREAKRRLEIDLAARTVRVSDDLGRGWQVRGAHAIVSADRARIVLEKGAGKDSFVDRLGGQYFFHNDQDGVTIRGPCEKAAADKPGF